MSSSIGSHSGHYNPNNDIVTRIEHLDERGMKAIIVSSTCSAPCHRPDLPPDTTTLPDHAGMAATCWRPLHQIAASLMLSAMLTLSNRPALGPMSGR